MPLSVVFRYSGKWKQGPKKANGKLSCTLSDFFVPFRGAGEASLDKKGGNSAGSDRPNMTGETVSARVFADPERAPDQGDPEQLDRLGTPKPSSASEKAEQLPHKMRIIVVAGLFIWAIIGILTLLFFF